MGAVGSPGPPARDERSPELLRRIRAAAASDGFLPFDRFLEIALYDPELGYYSRPELRLGRTGDFYTAPHVHPIFGRTIARRIRAEFERLGRPRSFRILEVGPGDGTLGADILAALREPREYFDHLEYVLVESPASSPGPTAARLRALGSPAVEVRSGRGLSGDGPFVGVVIAHELLDALPFRRIVRRSSGWQELGIATAGEGLAFRERPLLRRAPLPALPEAPDGTVLELSAAAEGWIRELADQLVDGVALLIDYGADESELLARGPRGTLAAVRQHRTPADPLGAPGTQDLSAFVNFTRIRAAAARAGLREIGFRRQAEALGAWGFEAVLGEAIRESGSSEAEVRVRLAAKNLLFGFDNFYALELGPAVASAPR
jgi:SAM-dependent MidA family methyltransferase